MYLTDKHIVKERFQKNYTTYNTHAVVQKQIALKLVHLLVKNNLVNYHKILEIGCGTGFLTEEVLRSLRVKEYIINDLTSSFPQSIQLLEEKYHFNNFVYSPGDAEIKDFPHELDAIFSTSTFQWFHQLESFFSKAYEKLNTNGVFAFSTFGKDNFKELRTILNVGLNYKSMSELTDHIKPNYDIIHATEWNQTKLFKTPIEVLKHVKKTGVNGVCQCYFGKEKLINFEKEYTRLFSNSDQTVNLTYHPIIIIAKKKS